MRKSKLLIVSLMLGIVVTWLSLFSTTTVFANSNASTNPEARIDNVADDVTTSISLSGLSDTDAKRLKEAIGQINANLNNAGYFKQSYLENGRQKLTDAEFLSIELDKDKSLAKKQNNTTIAESNYVATITGKWTVYKAYDTDTRTKIYTIVLSTIQNSNKISQGTRVKLYNYFVSNDEVTASLVRQLSTDVYADFASGYTTMKGVFPVVSTFLGVLAIAIFVGLGIAMLIDISYIVIPAFQLLDDGKEAPHFFIFKVSPEAWKAVREVEQTGANGKATNRDAIEIYLHSKTKQIVVLSICLLYLVSGKLYWLLTHLIDLFQGFLPQ